MKKKHPKIEQQNTTQRNLELELDLLLIVVLIAYF